MSVVCKILEFDSSRRDVILVYNYLTAPLEALRDLVEPLVTAQRPGIAGRSEILYSVGSRVSI